MKYSVQDMWMTLAWIRELAPIIIHIDLPSIETFLLRLGPSWLAVRVESEPRNDTHYRNQFETRKSGGLLDPKVRNGWERSLFGHAYEAR